MTECHMTMLRVTRSTCKETVDGVVTTLTIAGRGSETAIALTQAIGQGVRISTAGDRRYLGALKSVAAKEAKEGGPAVSAKVRGDRELDGLVGLEIGIEDAEPELQGLRQAVENLRPKGKGIDCIEVTGPDGEGFRLEKGKTTVDRVARKRGRSSAAGDDQ